MPLANGVRAKRMPPPNIPKPVESPVRAESGDAAEENINNGRRDSVGVESDTSSITEKSAPENFVQLPITGETIKVCVRIRPLVRSAKDANEVCSWAWDTQSIRQDKFPLSRSMVVMRERRMSASEQDYSYSSFGSNRSRAQSNMSRMSSQLNLEDNEATWRPYDPLLDPSTGAPYVFDHLFTPENTTADIYTDVIHNIVEKSVEGYHGSVFSYGQTSSGKTFTMVGTTGQPGIIPQAVFDVFNMVESNERREYTLWVSYLEVYKEQVKDLLNKEQSSTQEIRVLFDPKTHKLTMPGLKEPLVRSAEDVMRLLAEGERLRHVGATNMNDTSSRAHTVFRMIIESKDRKGGNALRSTLNLIDLAGSENSKMTGSTGERELEGKFINQSLLALSTIIQRLSEAKTQHLPFRDSKLTRILQEPLSGNAVIAIICTIAPSLTCADESHNTLKFATRAKKVKLSAAALNQVLDERDLLLKAYREEIAALKKKLHDEMASSAFKCRQCGRSSGHVGH